VTGPVDDELPPALRAEYLAGASQQLDLLAQLGERLDANPTDAAALQEFRREVHKIRGAAGSFGFPEGSRVAAAMEETAKEWVADPADRSDDRAGIVRWFVKRLADVLGLGGPRSRPAEVAAAPPTPPPSDAVPEIVLVEDDIALAELLEFGLRARGYRFTILRNGREALQQLITLDVGKTQPLLLLDVDLPGLDGYSVFDALQRERPGAYKVVFTTVHGTEDEQLRGLEAGALDYLVKPISLRVALEKIRRWVGR
jgi:CheY-like chemotaxis protein/HPt (histidine-containing phosphotransfer) domain-containing protein